MDLAIMIPKSKLEKKLGIKSKIPKYILKSNSIGQTFKK